MLSLFALYRSISSILLYTIVKAFFSSFYVTVFAMTRFKKFTQAVVEIVAQFNQNTRIRWLPEVVAIIAEWFNRKNFNTDRCDNANYYMKDVKLNSAKKCFANLNLKFLLSEFISQKLVEKFAYMMFIFKNMRNKIDFTSWDVDFESHNKSMNEQKHIAETFIIKTLILAKILWYYEFEKIMSERSNVTFAFLFEFEQSNRRNLRAMNSNDELIEENNDFDDDENVEAILDDVWSFIQAKTFDDDDSNNFLTAFTFDENDDDAIVDEANKNARKKRAHIARMNDLYVRFDVFETSVLNNTLSDFTNFQNLIQNTFFVVKTFIAKFAKLVVLTITKANLSKFFVFVFKVSVSASISIVKVSAKIEFFKRKRNQVVALYEIESDNDKERNKKKQKSNSRLRFVIDALIEIENKRVTFVIAQNKLNLKERRMQMNREILQRDRETIRQNQQHQKRMLQMQIQLEILKNKDKNKKRAKYSFFFDSQNLDAY